LEFRHFSGDWNLYHYTRIPIWLAAGVQVLTRLLDRIFYYIKFEFFYKYLDYFFIYSEDFESLVTHVEDLTRLRKAKVKPDKTVLPEQQISF
jgi:hypothetical protein